MPVRFGADPPGEPADAVGEGAGAGVGEPAGQLVPRGEAADARVGEAGAETILEPPVELDQTADEAFDALVARDVARVGDRFWRRLRTGLVVVTERLAGGRVRRRGGGIALGPPTMLAIDPGRDGSRLGDPGDVSTHPQHEQGDDVLAGVDTARAGAPRPDIDVVHAHVVGLGAGTVVPPPHGSFARAGTRPSGRYGHRFAGTEPCR